MCTLTLQACGMTAFTPFWRKLVGIVTILGYILAAFLLIAAFITISKASVTAGLVGIVLALFVAVMARVGKEASLMLADLSDASVRPSRAPRVQTTHLKPARARRSPLSLPPIGGFFLPITPHGITVKLLYLCII